MNANERDEISASVAAHAELGARYDTAVAEGLVERIGAEIDKRIDARIGGQPGPETSAARPPAYRGPAAPVSPIAATAPPAAPRRTGGLSGVILGLGSSGIGLGATAVVVAHHVQSVAALLMILLIWGAILGINIAHSQRKF